MLHALVILVMVAQSPPPQPPPPNPPGPAIEVERDQPITHLFQNLGHDLEHLATPESGWLLVYGFGGAALVHPLDDNIAGWVRRQPSSGTAGVGNVIGDAWTQASGAFAAWTVGELGHHRQVAHIGSDLIRAQALNGVLTMTLKEITNRDRPDGNHKSFPSGHTSATFATAAVLQSHYGWGIGAVAYAAGGFVGWSRIRSNHHWLSDVVCGSAIGIMSGRTVARGHSSKNWTVAPVKVPGGAAIYFVRR